tara:strand:- start:50 stop:292 length:243 start_codon:yes stop_codon:yes gene_type:complete
MKKHKRLEVFLEFLIFGVVMGLAEDLLAVKLATDAPITWTVFWIVLAVTIPFAVIGELIVDRKQWLPKFKKTVKKDINKI